MFLSDARYLTIRTNLREILRDSRNRIEDDLGIREQIAMTQDKGIKRDFLQKCLNGIDYKRAKEFYYAMRDLRKDNIQIPCFGTTYVPNRSKHLIMQAEKFAREIKKIRIERLNL